MEVRQLLKNEKDLNTDNLAKIRDLESKKENVEEQLNSELQKIKTLAVKDFNLCSELDVVANSVRQLSNELNLEVVKLNSEYD